MHKFIHNRIWRILSFRAGKKTGFIFARINRNKKGEINYGIDESRAYEEDGDDHESCTVLQVWGAGRHGLRGRATARYVG
jgi:hypothetical protein